MTGIKRLWDRVKFLILKYPNRAQFVIQSMIGVLTAFGLQWTVEQVTATLLLSSGLLALFAEQNVTPMVDPTLPAGTLVNVVTPDPQVPDKVVTVR